ncbi:transcriptional regulator [Marinomonas sp. MED121]|uniref:helix-turn-helix domain-containing protein n=1 Tax=Marinomonas sp. MED121 TaxID=314277 RepID=UPI000068FF50|nr:helix-turn-helix domain-containing protein [Marinomonas sp. MED121]EAQ67002.1 transcriptional regulator [Marinomonas sp. MED121]
MRIGINDLYNQEGQVSSHLSHAFSGYKQTHQLMSGLSITQQEIGCSEDTLFFEEAKAGVYFSLLGNKSVFSPTDFDSLQVSCFDNDVAGEFEVKAGELRSLIQIHFEPELLANALNEVPETLMVFFKTLIHKIAPTKNVVCLPITERNLTNVGLLMAANEQRQLSLVGQVYAFAFLALEQMQTLSHMLSCNDCQSKLFNVQNLLEADIGITKELTEFANQAGLNADALELGFYHLVGQTVSQYQDQFRLKRAAAMLRTDHYSRSEIVAKTGFSEDQFEAMFIRQFGVPTNQYGQVH